MTQDTPPDLAEALDGLNQALEEFRQIKERLKAGPAEEPPGETAPAAVDARPEPDETP